MADKDHVNAFIGNGVVYEGELTFQGTIRIDGSFTGRILSDGKLVLGRQGVIKGDVMVAEYIADGLMEGRLRASATVILMSHARTVGEVYTPVLVVDEGAVIDGAITMGPLGAAPDWATATASAPKAAPQAAPVPALVHGDAQPPTEPASATPLAAPAPPASSDATPEPSESLPGDDGQATPAPSAATDNDPAHGDAVSGGDDQDAGDDPPLASVWHASRRF
ncbi:MAG: polymer-forming cytoskeletal protein [Desulfovibrionaceae bacterium]